MTTTVSEDVTTDEPAPRVCSVTDCPEKVAARGWCMKHYMRWRRTGSTESTQTVNKGKPCSVKDCGNDAHTLGWCEMHYRRWREDGDVGEAASRIGLPLHKRAMRMVDTSAGPDACHPWTSTVISDMPAIFIGPRTNRSSRSARRVIAHHEGLLGDVDDQSQWVRMRSTCDPLCCNTRHMDVTKAARPNTRKDA